MKAFGGLTERRLVLVFLAVEAVFALVALAMYFKA
jgi:hypothetical protein